MNDILSKIVSQFSFEPEIVNAGKLSGCRSFTVGGMGGSHIAADLILAEDSALDMTVHSDYGLPPRSAGAGRLFVAVSHSGNTEETIDFAESALESGLPLAAVSTGGALTELARREGLPFVALPRGDLQPRMATGSMMAALLAIMGLEEKRAAAAAAAERLDVVAAAAEGRRIADAISDASPLFYASSANAALARFWKIVVNETAKVPAFWNEFPELNHNEMQSLAGGANGFKVIYLEDESDRSRVTERMKIMAALLGAKGVGVGRFSILGENRMDKILYAAACAHAAAFALAGRRGADPVDLSMVEGFKKELG